VSVLFRMARSPTGGIGLFLVTLLVAVTIFGNALAPQSPTAINVHHRLEPPDAAHWLGTDQLGRDTYTRVILGTRTTIGVALGSITLAMLGALTLGLIAGYGPTWLDSLLILLFDSASALPMIMLALAAAALIGPGITTVIIVIVLYCTPSYARMVRSQTLSIKQRDFVLAARAMNISTPAILARHLLPHVAGPLLIVACMDIATVIGLDAGLNFLGLGADLRTPNWGRILNDGLALIRVTPVPVIAAGVPLVLATLGFTFFGESLSEALDPKLRARLAP